MVLPERAGHRRSFVDARNDGRRMEVSWHEQAGVLVVSLWQGDRCRSTFQLPIEDAPALVGVLSSALTAAMCSAVPKWRSAAGHAVSAGAGRSRGGAGRPLLLRLLRLAAPRRGADVVPLRAAPASPPTDRSDR